MTPRQNLVGSIRRSAAPLGATIVVKFPLIRMIRGLHERGSLF